MRQVTLLTGCCLLLIVAGCDVSDPNAKGRNVANPPGIAPPDADPLNGNQAPAQPAPAPAPKKDGKGIIGKMTSEVVDYHEAIAANPNFEIIENKAKGDDLLSFYGSAYINARSRASTLGFEHWLKTFKVVEERNPTYAEFMQAMKENHIQFTARPEWDKYAYDSKEGGILIIQDKALKAERYKAAGIDPNTE